MSDVSSTRSLRAKLADLHVFVVPLELWLDKYRTAFNNIALESVSAGFVRVHPDLSLHHLRECLEEQLGEEVIPEEFIFLRSVGRCMAVVKENQERLLKVSDFLPPIAYSPEIFLLPGTHEGYARPATDSNNIVIATHGHTTAGMATTNPFHLPAITHHNLISQPGILNSQDHHGNNETQDMQGFHGNVPIDNRDTAYENNQEERDSFDGQMNSSFEDSNSNDYHDNSIERTSQESKDSSITPRREKKKKLSFESQNDKNKPKEDKTDNEVKSSPPAIIKIIEPQVLQSVPFQGPDGHLVAPPTPIPSGQVIVSPLPGPKKNKTEKTAKESKKKNKTKQKVRSRSPSLERQKVNIHTTQEDVIPTIEDVEDRSKYAQFPSPAKSTRNHSLSENQMDSGIADDAGLNDSLNSIKDGKDNMNGKGGIHDSNTDKSETDNLQKSNNLAAKTNHDRTENGKENKHGTGAGKNAAKRPKKTARKPTKKVNELDEKLMKLKSVEPPPITMPDPGNVSFEKDTHSAKDRKQRTIEELRGQLRKAKNERVDLEKQRDQKVRRAKSLQTQTLQKRNQGKNIWKKKFFDEKRKTAPLEEQLNRLRYDVEVQHKAIVSLLENKDTTGGKGSQEQDKTPSDKSNQLMLLTRIQNDVEGLKHKIEETKMRLASEMKLRDNAQSELKQLREDLIEKKINLTLTKSQKSLMVINNPENITA